VHPALDTANFVGTVPAKTIKWINDQNSVPNGTCNQGNIPTLLAAVKRHEGSIPIDPDKSHPGIGNGTFNTLRPQDTIERIYSQGMDSVLNRMVEMAVADFLTVIDGPYLQAQAQFDARDTRNVLNSAGCPFDFNPDDN